MANKNLPIVVVLTSSSGEDGSDTVGKIEKSCDKFGCKFYAVSTKYAYINDKNVKKDSITIYNYNGKNKNITLNPEDVVCFARGGVTNSQIGMAILSIFENTGMFIINESLPMELCANKLYSAIELDKHKINTPRTAFVANLSSLDSALKNIGNQFPVIVKTLTGAEGVGVSKIESYESLKSVLQTLWKLEAEVIIQEYLEIKNDVRVLVLDGKVVAAAMRGKAPKDFRTNLAQGAEGGPYELSDAEKNLAEKAASAFGTYYVGVDMVLSNGVPYIIELNASPGSGNVYRSYFSDSEGQSITGQKLIDKLVKYSIDRNNWHYNHRESGLIEPIEIKEVGKFSAKLDTGNESYNVLGAEDVTVNNGMVTFKVQGVEYVKPIVSNVRIRTNNDMVDRRPVVEFDIKFRNRNFKNIRFSLVPRRYNKYPVLMGNKFISTAKLTVNVNKKNTFHETIENENHYVKKLNTLNSYVQIDEYGDILRDKLSVAKDSTEIQLIEDALGSINVAKYNLKNEQSKLYNRKANMQIDEKFHSVIQRFIAEARKSRSYALSKTKPKNKKEWEKLDRALTRRKKASDRKRGITTVKSKEKHKARHFNGPKAFSAIRFYNYRKKNPRKQNGQPIQTGASAKKVDGDIKGRFKRYYKKKGDKIRNAVATLIDRGEWPTPKARAALAAGRRKRWANKSSSSKKKD